MPEDWGICLLLSMQANSNVVLLVAAELESRDNTQSKLRLKKNDKRHLKYIIFEQKIWESIYLPRESNNMLTSSKLDLEFASKIRKSYYRHELDNQRRKQPLLNSL